MSREHLAKLSLASMVGIGRRRFRRLVREFGSAQGVLDANIAALLTVPRVSFSLANRIVEGRHRLGVVERRWESLKQRGARSFL